MEIDWHLVVFGLDGF
jgi:hypothetical protein